MAVQVSYPGVYVEEFEPGAPIEGVGTSTAGFVGTAFSGPIKKPTLVQSWDAFVAKFGGIITDPPLSWLAQGVYGFFLNGGTACYIVRAGTGAMASANLDSRGSPDPALVVTAIQEGPAGNAITVQVADSSRLNVLMAKALPTHAITAMAGDRKTLTVDSNTGFTGGEAVTVSKGADSVSGFVASVSGTDTIVLAGALSGAVDFSGGSIGPSGTLPLRRVQTNVTAISGDRRQLTVASTTGLAPNDRLRLTKGADTATAIVKNTQGVNTINLAAPVAGAVDFGGGAARIDDLSVGQKTFRVVAPGTLSLNQALPQGSLIKITQGGTNEIATVDASGGDTVTVAAGLANSYSLDPGGTAPTIESLEFDIAVNDSGSGTSETFPQLSMNPKHPSYWATAVTSELVTLEPPATPPAPTPADPRPAAGPYPLAGGTADDRASGWSDLTANPTGYLDLLKPYGDISLVVIPGATDAGVQQAMRDHCESLYSRFAILDPVQGAEPGNGIRDQFANVRSARGFAALYYPWISVRNPANGKTELWPPSGHIAGIYARVDQGRGVHKAPANENIRGALGLERRLTDEEQGPLNLMGIDVLRVFPGQSQPVVWGARTTAGDLDRNWQYVNIRRLFIFLEQSIEQGIRWAVFEPNDLALWQKLKRSISEFLAQVWRDGALFGAKTEDAFYVRIDEALNPPSTRALGRLYIEVGVVPTYPAEFIILRIGIWQGGSEVSES